MKTNTTTLLFLLIQLSVFSQPKITREVTKFWDTQLQDWRNISENTYQYNEDKELTVYQEAIWESSENRFIGEKQITYDYFDLRTLISDYRSIYFDKEFYWVLNDTSEYIFNEEGCRLRFKESSNFTDWKWEHEYLENCLIKSSTRFYKERSQSNVGWLPYERILYSYSNDNKTKNYEAQAYIGNDEWALEYKGYEKFDDRGNVIEKYNSNDPTELFENTYDEKDRLLHQILYTSSGPDTVLTQRRETQYEYFEDENGFLIKRLLHRRYDNDVEYVTQTYLYENYCDGLARTEEYIRLDGTRRLWVYEYDEPTDCLESEEIKIQISPNPTSGLLTIVSELLYQNTEILIYTSNGQLVQNFPFEQRTDRQEVDLSSLPNGAYFVQLRSDNHSIVEPFIVLK